MSIHDWSRVEQGVFHHFHHAWIEEISRALNAGLLPSDYYAMAEQHAAGFGPDVLTLQEAVRHVTGDHLIAVVEIVLRGNKSNRSALLSYVEKASELLDRRIHILIVDLHAPGKHDSNGIHAAIWEFIADETFIPPPGEPLTQVAYESALTVKAYLEPAAVGMPLSDMPLFIEPGAHVLIPLEQTYTSAFNAVPRSWQRVLSTAG